MRLPSLARIARNSRRSRLVVVATAAVALGGGVQTARSATPTAYVAPTCTLAKPTKTTPSRCGWNGVTLQSPLYESQVVGPDLSETCDPKSGACEDIKVTVPAGAGASSLYVRIGWRHPVWKAYMYVIDPAGVLHGTGGLGCDESQFEKGCGNETTLPVDELVVANPMAGTWTVRVAAVNIKNEAYTGQVALTAGSPLAYAKKTIAELTASLTRHQPINVVFAGWKPTAGDLADLRSSLAPEIVPSVSSKQSGDCIDGNDGLAAGLVQHQTCHFSGTADPKDPNYDPTGIVPYFEPVRYLFDYHFLAADDTWTKDLFAAMKAATTQDHTLSGNRIPTTSETAAVKAAYLQQYNLTNGQYRGSKRVLDTSKVDEVDGIATEDWIQNHRFDAKYATSFTDLVTNAKQSAAFINPDKTAKRDSAWDDNGKSAVNVDRNPQGVESGLTFFLLDTFTPSYADSYFRPDHYHYLWTADHVIDPDANEAAFIDNSRTWGGRYRFQILDLGAAPSTYERLNWLTATAAPDGGSAAFDPPIWDYRNSPKWNGTNPPGALAAGGNKIGSVQGWTITQALAFKYAAGYLYRPIPNDVYVLAFNNLADHYSLPSEGDLYHVDMSKVGIDPVALKALNTSMPYANFTPGPTRTGYLGCAKNHVPLIGDNPIDGIPAQIPDPKCTGSSPLETPDGLQQAIEDGKAHGSGGLLDIGGTTVPTYAVNQHYIREYVDAHRDQYAPLHDGAFTIPIMNIMFQGEWNVALPLVVGGIAENANGGDGWGQIDNVNDELVPAAAIQCAQSSPVAPGCNGIPDTFRHDYGLTYTMLHEGAHFLGMNHPHDGAVSVSKSSDGSWHYYYDMLKWQFDSSASPTTYAGSYGTYEITDQEKLMVGHLAEYRKQAQDAMADAWFRDGMAGRTTPSDATKAAQTAMQGDIWRGETLFRQGDYLHAMYAMRNAALHAQGVTSAPVAPHRVSLNDEAAKKNLIFTINPQAPATTKNPPAAPSDPFPSWMVKKAAAAAPASTTATTTATASALGAGRTVLGQFAMGARNTANETKKRSATVFSCHINWQ